MGKKQLFIGKQESEEKSQKKGSRSSPELVHWNAFDDLIAFCLNSSLKYGWLYSQYYYIR